MALLTDPQRVECWADYMETCTSLEAHSLTKADLRAAINAIDTWISDNQASFKASIPEPAKTVLTNPQKARLFFWVAHKRYDNMI